MLQLDVSSVEVQLMEVVRAADVGVIDRRSVHGLSRCAALEIVLEDGSERGIGRGADLQGPFAGRFQPFAAMGLGEAEDADTGAEALFGMGLARRMTSIRIPVWGPLAAARLRMRSGVQLAWRRCEEGICSATVVWRRFMVIETGAALLRFGVLVRRVSTGSGRDRRLPRRTAGRSCRTRAGRSAASAS